MYFNRTLLKTLERVNKSFPVILLTGPRQVGKTTFLKHAAEQNRSYVSLDDRIARTLAKEDPELFFQKYKTPLLIDEIQYAPELLPYIKMTVNNEKKPGLFWLTGSQKFHLMKGVSESLAGRIGILQMLGLSLKEIFKTPFASEPFLPTQQFLRDKDRSLENLDLKKIYELIWRGSFPSLYAEKKEEWALFYQSYINTYIERDIRDLAQVADEQSFFKFLRASAARTGQLLNLTDMSRDAGISVNTAKNWLSLLETSGIIYLLEPYSINRTTRLIKAPKLYFLDTGLCSFLTNWQAPETLEAGAMNGALFETLIVSEIIKSYWHNGQSAPLYFYRDTNKNEVDLLIEQNGKIYPIEIKKTASPSKSDIKAFSLLTKLKMPIEQGAIICLCKDWMPITREVDAVNIAII